MILFSVVVPVHNVDKYLGRCIYSVLEQTYPYYEIILVDDGSVDASGAICDRYAKLDDRIKVFHQENQGQIFARINGINGATGDYYLFLDGDDYWEPDLLDTVYNAIQYLNCDMVIYNFKRVTQTSETINIPVFENGTIFDMDNKEVLFEELIKGNRLNHIWAKAVSRDIMDTREYQRYKNLKHAGDLLLSLPLLYNAKRILYLSKPMYNYRMTPGGITHTFHTQKIKDVTMVWSKVRKYMNQLNMRQKNYLELYYQTYVKNLLTYVISLCQSNINYKAKLDILHKIRKYKLYHDAIPYMKKSKLTKHQKILFFLFQRKCDELLILYSYLVVWIKPYLSSFITGGH